MQRDPPFQLGDTTQATYCLSLACCFYLKVKWVMDRFFVKELETVQQADLRLVYDNDQLEAAYQHCEDLFAQEFTGFMKKLGRVFHGNVGFYATFPKCEFMLV